MRRIFIFIGLLSILSTPVIASAQGTVIETINARILPSIWYSKLSTEDGKNVEVHAGIQNNSGIAFTGTALLYVDDVLMGQKEFSSEAVSLKDVFVMWKATSGQHVFQIKIKASVPKDKDLVSYKSDLSYMSVSNDLSLEDIKKGVVETASSVTSNTVQKIDGAAQNLVEKLEAVKKPMTEEVAKKGTMEKASISSILKSNQMAAVFNTGVDGLSFLVHQWKWTLSVLVLIGIFIFLRRKAVF